MCDYPYTIKYASVYFIVRSGHIVRKTKSVFFIAKRWSRYEDKKFVSSPGPVDSQIERKAHAGINYVQIQHAESTYVL